uniref:Gag-pol polyprotein n=1 Tax=Solanum tuberosum TaxID=4113 RepID=M1DHP7_SOLTU
MVRLGPTIFIECQLRSGCRLEIMPPRRVVRGHPSRMNVDPYDQGVPNAPKVQPQGEVTNAEFWDDIRMSSQVVTNQARQQRGV